MKIHRLLCAFTALIAFFSAFCVIASAEITADFENDSFYAPADVQEKLYELIINCYSNVKEGVTGATAPASELETIKVIKTIKEKGLLPVKGSAMPVYSIDGEKFANTGEISIGLAESTFGDPELFEFLFNHLNKGEITLFEEIPPELKEEFDKMTEEHLNRYNTYHVKMAASDGKCAGYLCVKVNIKDNKISINNLALCYEAYVEDPSKAYGAPLSYAEQAERIKNIFSLNEVIPPENVRLVPIGWGFKAYYIKTEDVEAFVPVGYVLPGAPDDVVTPEWYRVSNEDGGFEIIDLKKGYMTVDEARKCVKNVVDYYKKRFEANREYYMEHGDILFGANDDSRSDPVGGSVNAGKAYNVTDIKGYFEGKASAAALSASDAGATGKTEESAANIWLPVGAAAVIIAVFAAGTVILIKKKAK